jgi:HD-GYP domain-containing protein (c-di-GMP phosphodiesterase class II)
MNADAERSSGVRLAELVAALSLATDLGLGVPQEHVLRQTMIASRIAELAGLSAAQRTSIYYASLLAWVGCVSDSHEMAKWFGDDQRVRSESYEVDKAGLPFMSFMVGQVAHGLPPMRRLTMIGRFMAGGFREAGASMVMHCQTAGALADRLGLADEVGGALAQAFERWDGKGVPGRSAGDAIDPVMRVVQIADDAEVYARLGGFDAAVEMLRARRATEFDPSLVDLVTEHAQAVLGDLDDGAWDETVSAIGDEPLGENELTEVLTAFADYADLKSASWTGHSRGVARLAVDAARRLGLPDADRVIVERAALVHDIGALGVSTGIWDKREPWSAADRERVRTHPYLTERVLARPARLAEIGSVASLHHERLDGSGYPRGVNGNGLAVAARIVAAADVLHALGEDRVHRPAFPVKQREVMMREEVRAGRLDGEAVNAVLAAAGHDVRRRPELPAGLTPREVEVLTRLVRGISNKQIARDLGVTPRTVGSHVEHIYAKIGVSTRGAAALFAMSHGLSTPQTSGE